MQSQLVVLESLEGRFGRQLRDKDGFLNFGKFYKGEQEFPVGTVLNVDLYITDKGNRYINKAEVVEASVSPVAEAPKRGRKPKSSNDLPDEVRAHPNVSLVTSEGVFKPRDFDAENRGKTASLFVEALLSNPNVTQSLDDVNVDKMETLVWELVDLVFKTRKEKV